MAQREEREIDGVTVYIRKFEPFLAIRIAGDLQKYIVGPAGALFSMQDSKPGISLDEYTVERMIEKLSNGLDGKTLEALTRQLLNPDYVSVEAPGMEKPVKATEGNLNVAFANSEDPLGATIMIIKEVLMINFQAFFKRARTLFGSGTAAQPEDQT